MIEEPIIVELYNTNTSPIWKLIDKGRFLKKDEYDVPEDYWFEKAKAANAKLVIVLNQMDDDSGVIAFDECGHPIQI
jgi:hypothetical protein